MKLLTYEEACEIIHAAIPTTAPRETEEIALGDAVGRALAQPIYAPDDYPRFDNSAVDGYAIGHKEDSARGKQLRVCGEISTGDSPLAEIPVGCAVRIFTGAPVPPNSFGVAMQEDVIVRDGTAELQQEVREGQLVRLAGSDFRSGEQLLSPAITLNAGHVALLASVGKTTLEVFRGVSCAVLTTGNELVDPSDSPKPGSLRDSNLLMLEELARNAGCTAVESDRLPDRVEHIRDWMKSSATKNDLLIISGGASVGDYDFVARLVGELGTVLFHGVSVRPGKPILFGRIGTCSVFGLPGNPASVFVCFHIFVRDAIRRLGGHAKTSLRWLPVEYAGDHAAIDRDDFVRCKLDYERLIATPVFEQGSFGLRSLAEADALVRFPAGESGQGIRMALLI